MVLQGYLTDATGAIDNQLTNLQIASTILPPNETTMATLAANLDSNTEVSMDTTVTPAVIVPFDPDAPGTTSDFSTAVTVYDSLGNSHRVDVYFDKVADNTWDWHALVDGGELTGGTAGVNEECASGQLTFTTEGFLNADTTTTAGSFDFIGATAGQAISFDFGESIADGGTGQNGSTQYASGSTIRSQEQDGFSTGELQNVGVLTDGSVMALFSNGEQRRVGQVALATFEAEGDLARAGDNLWAETQDSGSARVGAASTGSAGAITANALEQSTVDLASEFVNLIAYERGFQANSRTITTADNLYQEVVNLKR